MPWHPFIVHFPIALWTMGCIFLLWAKRFPTLRVSAWILLTTAGLSALLAAISGQSDYQPLTNPPAALVQHQTVGIVLPWLMGGLLLIKAHLTLKKHREFHWPFTAIAWIILVLLIYTARLGGAAVYEFGVGQN